jgi:hypothetical protein
VVCPNKDNNIACEYYLKSTWEIINVNILKGV